MNICAIKHGFIGKSNYLEMLKFKNLPSKVCRYKITSYICSAIKNKEIMTPTKQQNVISLLTDYNTNRFFIEYTDGTTVEYQLTDDALSLSKSLYVSLYNEKDIEQFKASMKVFETN